MTGHREPLRMVVVGTRGHASRVAVPTVGSSTRAVLVGLLGGEHRRTVAAASTLGVEAYASVAEVLESRQVEAVWVTAPNHLHAPLAEEFLANGTHVLLEKPMAIDVQGAYRLVEATERTGAVLRVAFQHRFRQAHRVLRQALLDGGLGDLGYLRVHRNWQFPYFPAQEESDLSDWRSSADTSGGWVVNDIGSHLVDLVVWLGGGPVSAVGGAFARQFPDVDNDSTSHLTFRLGEHGVAQVDCSNWLCSAPSVIEAYGDRGWIRAFNSFSDISRLESDRAVTTIENASPEETYLRMLDDFVSACRGGPSDGTDARQGLLNVQLIQDARRLGSFVEDRSLPVIRLSW